MPTNLDRAEWAAAALRHFRQYRDVLMNELQCEPSPSLAELVGAGA